MTSYEREYSLTLTVDLSIQEGETAQSVTNDIPRQYFVCRHMFYESAHPLTEDENLHLVLILKLLSSILEHLYHISPPLMIEGVLFEIPRHQAEILETYNIFAYKSIRGQTISLYMPTHLEAFDAFVDFIPELEHFLLQFLWQEQRHSLLIRQFLKSQTLTS